MTRMNTLTKLLCALLVLCGLLCCAGAAGAEVVASGDCSAEGSSVQWTLDDAGTFTVSGTGAMADYTSSTLPWADYCDSVTNLVIEDGVTAIGNSSFYECSNLTSVEMPDSVTSIGKSAFSKCAGLTSLDLPDNVTFIGRETFYGCTGLTSLTIPASVTEMSDAFYGCSGLTDITISDGVTSIYDAFNRCTGLTSITIPNSVTSIRYAFHGCTGLESIVVPDSVTEMDYAFVGCTGLRSANIPSSVTSIDGAFINCTSLTSIEIPDSVTSISNSAFDGCTGLTSIAIPDSVTTIGMSAFSSCTGLTSIVIPDSVTTIDDSAFSGCTGLESVAIPNSVTEISFNAFDGCTQVSTVIISCTPNGAVCDCIYQNFSRAEQIYVHAYENGACTDCGVACTHEGGTLGTPVPTEDGTQHAATYTCCGAVVTGNHTYEDGACSACRAECSHTFTDGACTVCSLPGGYCGASTNEGGEQSVTWTLADNHLVISGTGAMADYSSSGYRPWNDASKTITDVTIGEGVTRIGKYAFYNFRSLTEITIPASVVSIGYQAFGNSTVSSVTFAPNSRLTAIDDYAFQYLTALKQITLPASVETIGNRAFESCIVLETVTFAEGSRLSSIGYLAFGFCNSLTAISVPESVTAYKTIDGVLYSGDGTALLCYPAGRTDPFTTPAGVTAIAEGAFVYAQVPSVTLSEGVTTLGAKAFGSCRLQSVSLPSTLTSIGNSAFASCFHLVTVSIPANVSSIGDYAFADCTDLTEVTIPASVSSIGMDAFSGCDNLTTVNAPCNWDGSLYTFEDTVTVNVPDHVFVDGKCTGCGADCEHPGYEDGFCTQCGEICAHTFEGGACTTCGVTGGYCGASTNEGGEQSVTWTLADNHLVISGTGAMADYSFYDDLPWWDAYQTITDVTIGEGVTRIGDYAFCNFCALTEITIPASVESIGYEAFRNSTVSSVTFAPNSRLTTIDDYAFSYLVSLKQITLPASVESIGDGAFACCDALETVTIAEGSRLSSLGYMPFSDCNSLTAISIPESATACKTIDGVLYSGDGTTLLLYPAGKTDEAFTTPAGVTTIAESALLSAQFRTVTLSEGVTTIGNSAFHGCYSMQSVSLPSTLTSIGDSTFFHCVGLTTVTIPASVTSIGTETFAGCFGLTEVTIPASVTSIGSNAFASCYELTTVNAPCSWDGSLYTFEDAVTVNVPDHAFADGACTACGVTGGYCGAAANAGGEQSVVWTYRDGTLTITGDGAMADYNSHFDRPWNSYASSVTTLHIGEGVTRIGSWALHDFPSVSELAIPASVTSIGESALDHIGATSIAFAVDSRLTTIETYAFSFADSLKQITLPASVESIGDGAFEDCDALETVTFAEGSRLSSLGNAPFYNCDSLTAISIPESVTAYRTIDGVLYSGDGTTLLYYPQGKTDESFTTPAGVTTIAESAFLWTQVSSVTLSEGVTTVGNNAFDSSTLASVSLPDTLSTIGKYAFASCSLTEVTIPASVKSIGEDAFFLCDALTTVNAPCNWDGSLYTFADTVTVNVPEHTGGTANCQSGAICDACGEAYGELDYDVHANTEVVWEWRPDDEYVYVYATLTCSDCGEELEVTSGEGEFLGETEGTDCKNPGSMSYSATLTFEDGTEVTDTHTVTIPSENHVGPMNNGFCAACGSAEKPAVDPGEYEDETWDDVYLISNAGQLYWFAAEVNGGNNGIGARLTANITVPASVSKGGSIPDWTPIGQGWTPYCGTFNGGGHTISGLYCESNRAGLFGYTDYHYNIRNIGVVNGTFIGSDYAGALAGYASSEISGCWASGNTVEGNYAGGLVGYNYGSITGSRATGNTVEGSLAGGLVGYNNNGTISRSYGAGNTVTGDSAGGLVGYNNNGTISRSYGAGNTVTGDSAGGLVGENYGTVENSYSTGNSAGYLVGYNGGPITNCFTDGSALFRDSYGDVTNSYYVAASATEDGGRTAAQFESGEIAWLLQSAIGPEEVWDEETGEWVMADAALVWGQSIGSASYPTLGGQRVYQVLSCDGEGTAYSNTDEQQKHSVINDVCANCGLFCPHDTGNGGICSICGATVERSMVILPASLTAVEAEAFTDTAVEAVVIPAGCTSIAAGAFSGCGSLKVIIFTSADCTIGDGAIPAGTAIIAPVNGTVENWAESNGMTFLAR